MTARLRLGIRRLAARLGLHVGKREHWDLVRRGFESPVPDFANLPAEVWERRSPFRGIHLDVDEQLGFAERELAAHIAEFDPPRERPDRPDGFFLWNTWYESVDAEVTYALVRHLRPQRVIELGSGFSTLVLEAACGRNAREGSPAEVVSYDPYPPRVVAPDVPTAPDLPGRRHVRAQDVPLAEFEALAERDVLFVDTSHTVRIGGDVNFVVLEVLPVLRPGVVIHFHDVFLPYEYPRMQVEERRRLWTEQYLLQAFLIGNRDWEVVFAAQAVARERPERLAELIPSYRELRSGSREVRLTSPPSSFWIRRTG